MAEECWSDGTCGCPQVKRGKRPDGAKWPGRHKCLISWAVSFNDVANGGVRSSENRNGTRQVGLTSV